MSGQFKPLVLNPAAETPMQQLQGSADLDIPLEDRFNILQERFEALVSLLLNEGFQLTEEIYGH